MKSGGITAEFIGGGCGHILVVARIPERFTGRCMLIVPPFAEEMNKSRRMTTLVAERALAAGVATVMVDLFGTGDSEGEFGAADCETWLADLQAVDAWAQSRGWFIDTLLAIRLGGLLAARYARKRRTPLAHTFFWQPVQDGARALDQFLRLRVAASMMEDKKETNAELKAQLAAGKVVEVAGYGVSPRLAAQLEQFKLLDDVGSSLGHIQWIEILRTAETAVPLPTDKAIRQLQSKGLPVTLRTVVGEPFWASTEVVWLPGLLDETAKLLAGTSP